MMLRVPVWGVLCVIGGFLYHLALGYFYTVANMNPYVISYMGIESGKASWFSSTILAIQAVAMPFGSYLAAKIGYTWILIAGIVFSSGGIILTRLTIDYGLGPYIATYCILFGIGMGLPYSLIFSIAGSWFPNHRATVVGIIAAGFGLGALVFTPIQKALINPKNLKAIGTKYPAEVEKNVPNAYLILGCIVLVLEIIATILLRQKPEENKVVLSDDISSRFNGDPSSIEESEPRKPEPLKGPHSYTIMDSLKSIDFYLLWIIVFLDIIPVVLLTSTYKVYGLHADFDDGFLADIATCTAVFNCLGRAFWGFIVDKFSSKCPTLTFLVIWCAFFVTFPYVTPGPSGKALYSIWVFALFFALSAHFVVMPATCTRVFGPANMATIYALVYLATCPSAFLTAAVLSQFSIQGQWIPIYSACACANFLALVLALFIRDKDAKCVGFTNKLCSRICDPCREKLELEEEEIDEVEVVDGFDIDDSSYAAAWKR